MALVQQVTSAWREHPMSLGGHHEAVVTATTAVVAAKDSPLGGVEGVSKDELGQDINCVVCGDKSSGKHYGQFTCEGKRELHRHAQHVFPLCRLQELLQALRAPQPDLPMPRQPQLPRGPAPPQPVPALPPQEVLQNGHEERR